MVRHRRFRTAAALAAAAIAWGLSAPQANAKKVYLGPPPAPSFHVQAPGDSIPRVEVHKLKPGVYAAKVGFTWTGWVELPEGILLIDTGDSEREARALADTIRARSGGRPFRYVVNTSGHAEHVAGDRYFADQGAAIVAQDTTASEIQRIYETELAPADSGSAGSFNPKWRRVSRRATFGKAPRLVQVLWLGHPGPTAADLVVYLPRQRVLFTGDLVSYQSVPWMLDPAMSVDGWRASLDSLATKTFAADSLVPGHGSITKPSTAFTFMRAYLNGIVEKAQKEAAWGTELTSIRDWGDLGSFEGLEFYDEVHFLNLRRLYNQVLGRKTPGRTRPSAFYKR